jgi:FkbM family methyltransferase
MKLTSAVYQSLLSVYRVLPCQSAFAHVLRSLPINLDRFYKDLHFKGTFKVKTRHSSFRLNHLGTTIENELFWKGLGHTMEDDTVWFWEATCRNSHVIFDVGANTGVYALMAKAENSAAKVIAFEPSIKIYPPLLENVRLNAFDIVCEKMALSNSNETQVFYDLDSLEFPTSGSLNSDKLKKLIAGRTDISEYEVVCKTLDTYLTENHLEKLDLMKIDVELHEPAVFEGFKRLQEFRPTIVVEVLNQDVGDRILAAANLTNYGVYLLVAPYKVKKLETIVADPKYRNVLLLPSEKQLPKNTTII